MASEDEVRRLILEVVGEDRVRKLREQIDQEKESLLKLTDTLNHLTPAQIAQDKSVQVATLHLADLNQELKRQVETLHLADLNQELKRTESSHRNLGYAALEASRAFEDLQYGIGGVINNIPGLVMALGGGAGVTAAISALLVVGNQLVKHFFPEWEGGVKKIKEEKEKLTEAMKEQKKALEALAEAETSIEKKRKLERVADVTDVVIEHKEEIRKALGERMKGESRADLDVATEREAGALGPFQEIPGEGIHARIQRKKEYEILKEAAQKRLSYATRQYETSQLRADVVIGRAEMGSRPDLARLQGLFPRETAIGAGLYEAGPERQRERERDLQDFEKEKMLRKRDAAIKAGEDKKAKESQRIADEAKRAMDLSFAQEETDLARQHSDDQRREQRKKHEENKRRQEEAKEKRESDRKQREREQAASHEAQLLEQSFGDRSEFLAKQAMARGFSPAQIQAKMAKDFMSVGATQTGANQAAQRQMEKVMVDIARNGGLAASLLLQQGKLQRMMLDRQNHIEQQLQQAHGDLKKNWDSAMKHGG